MTGWPIAENCTRIWFCNPVTSVTRTSEQREDGVRRNSEVQHEPLWGPLSGGQPLKHSFSPKVVNERSFFDAEMSANYCEILPHRSVAEKLSNERVSIPFVFLQRAGSRT